MVERLFLAVPWGCVRFVIVVFPDHTHLLFWADVYIWNNSILIHLYNNFFYQMIIMLKSGNGQSFF